MTSIELTGHAKTLLPSIEAKTATVGVIGLGYVGLPLLDAYISAGFQAIGFDVDQKKTDALNAGQSYIAHIGDEIIQKWLDKKKFEATVDMSRLSEADCVPTPLKDSRDPDLNTLNSQRKRLPRCSGLANWLCSRVRPIRVLRAI